MSEALDVAEATAMIRESAAGIATRDLARIRSLRFELPGFDKSVWREICEMGWLGLRLPEQAGGVGLGMSASCALLEELGAALVPEPIIGAMLAVRLIGDSEIAAVLSGERIILPAWQEQGRTLEPAGSARFETSRISGTKSYISMADGADAFVVAVQDGWVLVDRASSGLALDLLKTQDGGHYGTLRLDRVEAQPLPAADTAAAIAEATLGTAAYMLGVIEETFVRTLDFLRTRVQFGKAIGSFQALQHRMVDLKLETALTRASIADAARRWDEEPGSSRAHAAVSRAKARASATVMLVTRQAIQLHGGIGYTDEHDIGLFLRKAMVLAPAFGDASMHRRRFADLDTDGLEAAA